MSFDEATARAVATQIAGMALHTCILHDISLIWMPLAVPRGSTVATSKMVGMLEQVLPADLLETLHHEGGC
jgi:hypothetical protein